MADDDAGMGVPEWVVTFGDMMSLLLTFFIMLVSLSEVKQEEKYQAMVESMRQQFGYSTSMASFSPGNSRPRNSKLAHLATTGRARRMDTMQGGDKARAPVGDFPTVQIIRPGDRTAVGAVIRFPAGDTEIPVQEPGEFGRLIEEIRGKPQKIEIRGHTGLGPDDGATDAAKWETAFRRVQNVMLLLKKEGVETGRIRMAIAQSHEPVYTGTDPALLAQNPRVEIYLLDEFAEDAASSKPGDPKKTN